MLSDVDESFDGREHFHSVRIIGPVHVAFPVLIGAGGVASTFYSTDWYDPYEYRDGYLEDAALFFVAGAGAELELNQVRFFRLALFGINRYPSDIHLENTPVNTLRDGVTGSPSSSESFEMAASQNFPLGHLRCERQGLEGTKNRHT